MVLRSKQQKHPFWFVVLFIVALTFTLTSLGVNAYKYFHNNLSLQVEQSALESRKQLILLQPDVINTNWLHTLNPLVNKVQGRLVWSTKMQQGIMEFTDLPKIKKNQKYRLWVYDLVAKNNKAILSAEFQEIIGETFLILFNPEQRIDSPYKFELMLQTKGEEKEQPLFLAQP